jgi:hypothetical protein
VELQKIHGPEKKTAMTRQEMKANKERMFLKELIDKMFEIAGHDVKFEDVEGRTDNWFQEYTMTEEQNKEWREWGTKHIKKKKRLYSKIASREMAMLDLYCGLKIENK